MTTLREQLEVARQLNRQQQLTNEDLQKVLTKRDEHAIYLREQIERAQNEIKELKAQVQWHKTLNQNLTEAVTAHARGR